MMNSAYMSAKNSTSNKESGFTLIELMATVVVVGIVISGAWQFTISQSHINNTLDQRVNVHASISAAFNRIARDINNAGFGATDLPASGLGNAPPLNHTALVNAVALTTHDGSNAHALVGDPAVGGALQSIDDSGIVTTIPGADELVVGSTLFDFDDDVLLAGTIPIAPPVGGGTFEYVPFDNGAAPMAVGDRFVAVSGGRQIFPVRDAADPLAIAPRFYTVMAIAPGTIPGRYQVVYDYGGPRDQFGLGTEIFPVSDSRVLAGERVAKVQYALEQVGSVGSSGLPYGTLRRFRFLGSAFDYSNVEPVAILNNTLQFQVQFLVWPCDLLATQPVWMDNPDGDSAANFELYANPMYHEYGLGNVSISSAYRARRFRIHAVRVAIAAMVNLDPNPYLGTRLLEAFATNSLQLQNANISNIPDGHDVQVREMVIDPISFRFREAANFINNQAVNAGRLTDLGNCGVW